MPELEFFLIAEAVSLDQSTNRLSIFSVAEELQVTPLGSSPLPPGQLLPVAPPAMICQLVAVSSWNVANEEIGKVFTLTLKLHPPEGEPRELQQFQFQADRSRQRIVQTMIGLPFTGPGEWRFEVLLGGKHEAYHKITVQPSPAPPSVTGEPG